MRSRWYHLPVLHAVTEGEGKKVTWLELFYDLIFVAAIIQLGSFLGDNVSVGGFALFAAHFVPLWIAWTGFTFYVNRFTVDDFPHRALVFAKMMAVGVMAIAAPEAMRGDPTKFALGYTVAQALVACMYLRTWRQLPESRDYCRYWGTVFAVGAVLWGLSLLVPYPYGYLLWGAGVVAIMSAPISKHSRALTERYPIDLEHLSERYGLLTIIVLGESFVKVLSFLASSEHGAELEYILKGFFNLILTCCVWWIYFDDIAGSAIRKQRGAWIVWLYSHIPLTIGITALGVAVKKAIRFDLGWVAPDGYRWLLAGSLALTFLAVAVIDSVTERRNSELSDRTRVRVRFGSALVVLLIGQIGGTMLAATFLALVTAISVAQVVFDLMMAPFEESATMAHVPVAELAVKRMEAKASQSEGLSRRFDVSQSVRLGAPAELRRDLYFFFMEGSWTRLLLSLAFAYILVNVVFAGLYLLQAGSMGPGNDTFVAAFDFSVQTFSTIGYGAMSPGTPWGNFVVTIEAAVGLLGVAVATGLMFAKASRPVSSVLFSKPMVLTHRNGRRALVFRVGNARGNEVVDASITLSVMKEEITVEGHHMRRLHDMKLLRSRSPMFVLSWVVIHEVDDDSPLADVDWEHPERDLVGFIATMLGHDGTYGQTTYARNMYYPEDVRVGHRFVDVVSELEDGRLVIDYAKFHETVADPGAAP